MPVRVSQLRKDPAGPPAAEVRGSPGGIGRSTSPAAEAVSDDLRRSAAAHVQGRRRVAGLTLGAMGSLGMVAAYQFGLVRRLPEPPVPIFDAMRVDASGEAYQYLKTPDAALGLVSTAATLLLAGTGDGDRWRTRPWLPLAMAAKVAGDAAFGAFLTAEQASKHRRFCSWCLAAAVASVAAVPPALPEARAAWRALRGA
ncbi:MAG: vitamin K epoxide reductase [Actinomycetota bacterium]|nr:vitamin K epoxide reductase [Actinomycetota bacterium]